MTATPNVEVARRLFEEVISQGKLDVADELIAPDCVDHNPGPGQGPGRRGIVCFFEQVRAAFPDWAVRVEDVVAQDDRVVARLTANVTHAGTFLGIPPTGRRVDVRVIDILRLENGRVVERWGERNDLEILRQIGRLLGGDESTEKGGGL